MEDFRIAKSVKMLMMEFPSNMDYIDAAIRNTSEFVTSLNKTIDAFGLKLVLSEGITNAVVHGNNEHENRPVTVHITLTESNIEIRIKDSGKGFTWKKYMAPAMNDTERTSGRGFSLIKAYGYDVTFNKRGNTLIATKQLDEAASPVG